MSTPEAPDVSSDGRSGDGYERNSRNSEGRRNWEEYHRRGFRDVAAPDRNQFRNESSHRSFSRQEEDRSSSTPRGGDRQVPYGSDRREYRGSSRDGSEYRKSGHFDFSDWKCLECSAWNYPDEERCHRCDLYPPSTDRRYNHPSEHQGDQKHSLREGDRRRNRDSLHNTSHEEKDDVDEFGRRSIRLTKRPKQAQLWPPCFDTCGADYVLDPRCSMFYHAATQFFYDPQTKLYYGNQQSTYYRWNEDSNKFEEVQKVDVQQQSESDLEPVLAASLSNKTGIAGSKPSISINLKTKKLPKVKVNKPEEVAIKGVSTDTSASSGNSGTNPLLRKHEVDMNKWSERQEELKQAKNPSSSGEIARTAKGEPICLLCQRKFATVEKLEYHERVSKLHADNIKAAKKEPLVTGTTAYQDRAQQRRVMYREDAPSRVLNVATVTESPPMEDEPATPIQHEQILGSQNVGNQMLQKLGWKLGQAIGRRTDADNDETKNLRRDWERIEALAQQQDGK